MTSGTLAPTSAFGRLVDLPDQVATTAAGGLQEQKAKATTKKSDVRHSTGREP